MTFVSFTVPFLIILLFSLSFAYTSLPSYSLIPLFWPHPVLSFSSLPSSYFFFFFIFVFLLLPHSRFLFSFLLCYFSPCLPPNTFAHFPVSSASQFSFSLSSYITVSPVSFCASSCCLLPLPFPHLYCPCLVNPPPLSCSCTTPICSISHTLLSPQTSPLPPLLLPSGAGERMCCLLSVRSQRLASSRLSKCNWRGREGRRARGIIVR